MRHARARHSVEISPSAQASRAGSVPAFLARASTAATPTWLQDIDANLSWRGGGRAWLRTRGADGRISTLGAWRKARTASAAGAPGASLASSPPYHCLHTCIPSPVAGLTPSVATKHAGGTAPAGISSELELLAFQRNVSPTAGFVIQRVCYLSLVRTPAAVTHYGLCRTRRTVCSRGTSPPPRTLSPAVTAHDTRGIPPARLRLSSCISPVCRAS